MYFSIEHITTALKQLEEVHPFHGITFMACKKAQLPIGLPHTSFHMDAVTRDHMRTHHRLSVKSKRFYQPFKSSKRWLAEKYPSSGLQAINTQTFGDAFIHEPKSNSWAWSPEYVDILASKLSTRRRIPLYAICVWLYRCVDLPPDRLSGELVERFLRDYHITTEERARLFDSTQPPYMKKPLQENIASLEELGTVLPPPPDADPERDGRLTYLRVNGSGPTQSMVIEPAERLTLIAGDNGLGKTFLLDCAWWALTGCWAALPAAPRDDSTQKTVSIQFVIRGPRSYDLEPVVVRYDRHQLRWQNSPKRKTITGLVVYACVDGSFAVWDPVAQTRKSVYSRKDVWDGVTGSIEGLVRDWRNWQYSEDHGTFNTFCGVLKALSPSDLGILRPGQMTRVPYDSRDIPTIEHRYGRVPIVYASAAVKRIVSLAYLMVWAWKEHHIYCRMAKRRPERRMVMLVYELESHLHPRWQRQILPALVSVVQLLGKEVDAQLIVSTHSPLVMASSETIFNRDRDVALHLMLQDGDVDLRQIDHRRHGKVDRWLTSSMFGLVHPRSKDAEDAIEQARRVQRGEEEATVEAVREVSERLLSSLADNDDFWPRWIGFAEQHGVEL